MQMDVYIVGVCMFATCMRKGCVYWETSFPEGCSALLRSFISSQTSSEKDESVDI